MDPLQLVVLAIVQGITEFLPISSSGHLILTPKLFDWEDQGPLLDVAVHLGSLAAVLVYFWRDMRDVVFGPFHLVADVVAGRPLRWSSKLALLLGIATIPVGIFGLVLWRLDLIDQLRNIEVIGWTTLCFGVALYVADRYSSYELELKDWSWGSAVVMGLAQALALIPGTSRSGVTMTAARFMGYDRRESARISMLMAMPAILIASVPLILNILDGRDAPMVDDGGVSLGAAAGISALLAFLSALGALALMMRWLRNATFLPFVIYRIALGGVLLWIAYAPGNIA